MRRELRRERRYDAIILDPPTFGRGAGGEMYRIERDLKTTLELARDLLSETPRFLKSTGSSITFPHAPGRPYTFR